jgi:hypothetical protein
MGGAMGFVCCPIEERGGGQVARCGRGGGRACTAPRRERKGVRYGAGRATRQERDREGGLAGDQTRS